LIVVEHRMFADVLSSVLRDRGVDVVGVAETAADAIETTNRTRPDVVVVGVESPDGGGLGVGRQILSADPSAKLIALVTHADIWMARHALSLGFRAGLTKDVDTESFLTAIKAVADGQTVSPPQAARRTRGRWPYDNGEQLLIDHLTAREREVVRLIATAASSEEIAGRLSISVNTVRSHIQSIFTKLQVHSRLEAVAFAARHDLLSPPLPTPAVHITGREAAGSSTG
jgi:two-component system nitrate/nitrite response regulator NarL